MGQVRLEEGSQSPLPEEGCPGYRGQVTPWQIIFHFFFSKKKALPPPFSAANHDYHCYCLQKS